MTITDYSTIRTGSITTVVATSDLAGTVYFHWYLDGVWLGVTQSNRRDFHIDVAEQARVEVVDTNDVAFDYVAGAPAGWPARRLVAWVRSLADDVATYRVEQQRDGGDWETVGIVPHDPTQWDCFLLTERLDDLTDYAFRVIPVDEAGNDGAAVTLSNERIVRSPDSPDFQIGYDAGTDKITFAEDS